MSLQISLVRINPAIARRDPRSSKNVYGWHQRITQSPACTEPAASKLAVDGPLLTASAAAIEIGSTRIQTSLVQTAVLLRLLQFLSDVFLYLHAVLWHVAACAALAVFHALLQEVGHDVSRHLGSTARTTTKRDTRFAPHLTYRRIGKAAAANATNQTRQQS